MPMRFLVGLILKAKGYCRNHISWINDHLPSREPQLLEQFWAWVVIILHCAKLPLVGR